SFARPCGPRCRLTAQAEPKYISRRVNVAVDDQTAAGATVGPLRERFRYGCRAPRAGLRTATGRNPNHLDTSILRFVPKQPQEFRPALVANILCQKSTGQLSNLEILDRDQTEIGDEPAAQLVGVIPPKAANPLVQPSQQQPGFLPAPRTLNSP